MADGGDDVLGGEGEKIRKTSTWLIIIIRLLIG